MSRRRCIWSGRADERVREVRVRVPDRFGRGASERAFWVLPEHEDAFRRFCDQSRRHGLRFLVLLAASVLVLIGGAVVAVSGRPQLGMTVVGGCMVAQGLLILRYPFSTPETVQLLGVANSIKVVRTVAVFNLLVGLGVVALEWLL